VIGDLALDAYWYVDMTRSLLSRETPHFPRPIMREVFSGGAGANVAHNLTRLGVSEVTAFSVLGDDWRGVIMARVLLPPEWTESADCRAGALHKCVYQANPAGLRLPAGGRPVGLQQ
jgi:bifunctional ADP-heptose synthase (sugar kinase/adenylyltransferase)